jgi:hypothetical protein
MIFAKYGQCSYFPLQKILSGHQADIAEYGLRWQAEYVADQGLLFPFSPLTGKA